MAYKARSDRCYGGLAFFNALLKNNDKLICG
jgi:hypothetical protein